MQAELQWSFVARRLDLFLYGAALDFAIACAGFLLCLVLGLVLAAMSGGNSRVTRAIAYGTVQLVRGFPLYILLLWIYFGVSQALGIRISPIQATVLALGITNSALAAEVFRAAFASIDRGQAQAARSLGMTGVQTYRYVLMPQALRVALPPLGNIFVMQVKGATYAAVVSVHEAVFTAQDIASTYFLPFESYTVLAFVLIALTFIAAFVFAAIERALGVP